MKIYKCIFDATSLGDASLAQHLIFKKISEVFGSFPNVRSVQSEDGDTYTFYRTFNLSGGNTDEFAFIASGNVSTPTRNIGLVAEGWESALTPGTQNTPSNWVYYRQGLTISSYLSNIMYFITDDDDQKLLGMVHPVGGFVLFYYDEDNGMYAMWQKQSLYNDWNPGGGATSITTDLGTGGISGARGVPVMYADPIIKPGENYNKFGYNLELISANIDNYTYPTGKMIKHATVRFDPMGYINGELPYPIKMFGNGVIVNSATNNPTMKKVSVDGKNYIHIGGTNWIEYSSITERTYTIT